MLCEATEHDRKNVKQRGRNRERDSREESWEKMNDEEYASNFWNREVLRKYFWEYDPQVQHFVCVRVIELPYEK